MHRADHPESGEQLFLQQLALIERVTAFVCVRHHLAAADTDDFASDVKLKLIEDNYAVLRKFEGRSTLKTYLTTVIQRLFLDYRISAWGKWRPSAEAKRGGPLALLVEQLTTRDGHSFDEACELLRTKHQVTADRGELEQIAAKLPGRPRRRFEVDDRLAGVAAKTMAPDDAMAAAEGQSIAAHVAKAMKALLARLDTQDRLLLTLRYQDGRTIADIAKLWRVNQKGLYRRQDRLLEHLRQGLEREGVAAGAVIELLENPAVHLDWDRQELEDEDRPGPSISKGDQKWL